MDIWNGVGFLVCVLLSSNLKKSKFEGDGCGAREAGRVQVELMDRLLDAVRCFNEAPEKTPHYTRVMGTGASFFSNVDLFVSKAARWRDTLSVKLGPNMPDLDLIPEICRRYFLLITFRSYLYSAFPDKISFSDWMKARPELGHLCAHLRIDK